MATIQSGELILLKSLAVKASTIGIALIMAVPLAAHAGSNDNATSDDRGVGATVISPLDEATRTHFNLEFERYSVSPEDQDRLIQKFETGQIWDSMSDASPITAETTSEGETVERFADGSIAVTSIEKPNESQGEIAPMGVSRCRAVSATNGYQKRVDCLVNFNTIQVNQSFEADYQVKSGAAGRILAVRNPVYWCYFPGCSMSSPNLKITRSTSSGSTPATARMTQQITYRNAAGNDIISSTLWVQLNVTTGAWSSNN